MKNRYDWIDALKGFGAILVILGHLKPALFIETYIYSFHMPLFFFISGMLKKKQEQPLLPFIKKRAGSLLIPLVVWNIISAIVQLVIRYKTENLLNGMLFINKELPMNTPIWFLLNLFICEVIYEVLTSHKVPDIIIMIAAVLVCPFIVENIAFPFTLYVLPMSMLFYSLGAALRPYMLKDKVSVPEKCSMPIMLVISVVFGAILNDRVSMANGYYHNILFFMIAAVSGVLLWTYIFRQIPANRIVIAIGKQSLFLMCCQYLLFTVASAISKRLFSYDVWNRTSTLKAILCTIAVLLICFSFVLIVKNLIRKSKWIPRILQCFGVHTE